MATKNLARTAIEGGRTGSNKFERRYSHKEERASERAALSKIKDADDWDDVAPNIKRKPVRKEFKDKLRPIYGFLDARVGKSWKKVYAEIREKFDDRTTAGRHILFDHLLREVKGSGRQEEMDRFYGVDYFIDRQGILRKSATSKRGGKRMDNKPKPKEEKVKVNYAFLLPWLKGRRVCVRGEKLFWWNPPVPTITVLQTQFPYSGCLDWVQADKNGEPILDIIQEGFYTPSYEGAKPYWRNRQSSMRRVEKHGWRQGSKLTEKEREYFESLPKAIQATLFGVKQPS